MVDSIFLLLLLGIFSLILVHCSGGFCNETTSYVNSISMSEPKCVLQFVLSLIQAGHVYCASSFSNLHVGRNV
jgi:hypothetical protein